MLTGYMSCDSFLQCLTDPIYINPTIYPTSVVINLYDMTM